jgi:hypothetical protein
VSGQHVDDLPESPQPVSDGRHFRAMSAASTVSGVLAGTSVQQRPVTVQPASSGLHVRCVQGVDKAIRRTSPTMGASDYASTRTGVKSRRNSSSRAFWWTRISSLTTSCFTPFLHFSRFLQTEASARLLMISPGVVVERATPIIGGVVSQETRLRRGQAPCHRSTCRTPSADRAKLAEIDRGLTMHRGQLVAPQPRRPPHGYPKSHGPARQM